MSTMTAVALRSLVVAVGVGAAAQLFSDLLLAEAAVPLASYDPERAGGHAEFRGRDVHACQHQEVRAGPSQLSGGYLSFSSQTPSQSSGGGWARK